MHERPDARNRNQHASEDRAGSPPRTGRSRTAAAGRHLLHALRADAAELAAWLRDAARPQRALGEPNAGILATGTSSTWRVVSRFTATIFLLFGAGTLAFSGAMLWALHDLPLERRTGTTERAALLLEAADGRPLGRVGPLKVAEASRDDYPEHLVQAVLSVEDRRFYSHFGIDPLGIIRAMRRNLAAGEIVEGGSTITQQLVKIRFLGNDRTYERKLREALTAIWLELRLGKDAILTRYLNSIYMGAGAYGMAAAARLYFDKQPSELTLAEAAMLAGMIRAPSQYNPLRNPEAARERAAVVLDSMVEHGAIDEGAAAEAKATPARVKFSADVSQADSWFADWVVREATDLSGSLAGAVRVRTTLMPALQQLAENIVNDALAEQGGRAGVSEAALVALRPDGAVLAMVGGRDYQSSQFNRVVEANRHPGSAFKLFVYLAALRKGYTPESTIDAGPIEIKRWRPENFGGQTYGRMTLAEAFARSVNTAAVRLAMDVGIEQVIAAARDLGIHAPLSPVPSLALGAAEVSLLDLTGAFASVRAGQKRVQPWGVAAFGVQGDSRLRQVGAAAVESPLEHHESLIHLLRLVVERGTGRAAALEGFAAGKTGTSQNHRDAWFIGFNESLVVGVWVGNDDATPMDRVVGGTLPASIWRRFMIEATPLVASEAPLSAETPAQSVPESEPLAEVPIEPAAQEMCNVRACASRYRSFRPSDCTYQPYDGPRRLCEIDVQPDAPQQHASQSTVEPRGAAQCNVQVCAQYYRSFDPADCTYQPYGGGPRRLCTR